MRDRQLTQGASRMADGLIRSMEWMLARRSVVMQARPHATKALPGGAWRRFCAGHGARRDRPPPHPASAGSSKRIVSWRPKPCAEPAITARGVVPEQLAPHRLRERAPRQHGVDRLRKPALGVRVVGGEHQGILAERLDGVPQRRFPIVELDALEILRVADVLAGVTGERW